MAEVQTNQYGYNRNQIDKLQFGKISFHVNDQSHYEEVRKIEQVFTCAQPFHIIHYNQVKVEINNGYDACQFKSFLGIEMKSKDKNIAGRQVDQGAYIKT